MPAACVCDVLTLCMLLRLQVSTLASTLPPLFERVSELEARLTRSLAIAKQGLDILADQLVALGALNGRSSPSKKNPLAGAGRESHCVRGVCVWPRRRELWALAAAAQHKLPSLLSAWGNQHLCVCLLLLLLPMYLYVLQGWARTRLPSQLWRASWRRCAQP